MRKKIVLKRSAALLLAGTMVVNANPVDASAAAKPAWKKAKATMTVGQQTQFTVKNKPAGGSVKFTSSKKAVATVGAKNGLVKAKKAGKTVIKAVVKNKKKKVVKTLKKTLTVKAKKFSETAKEKISAAGGSIEVL